MSTNSDKLNFDRAAIWLSWLCLLHCLAVPASVLLAPTAARMLSASETQVHWLLLLFAVPISAIALTRGYLRQPSPFTLILGCGGLLLMTLAVSHVAGHDWEIALTVVGVLLVLCAHMRNLRHASHSHSHD